MDFAANGCYNDKNSRREVCSLVKKDRIWEVDFLRGLLIPGMIAIHLIYDIVDLYGFVHWPYPRWYDLFKNNYGAAFVLLSGLSATLGSGRVQRACWAAWPARR